MYMTIYISVIGSEKSQLDVKRDGVCECALCPNVPHSPLHNILLKLKLIKIVYAAAILLEWQVFLSPTLKCFSHLYLRIVYNLRHFGKTLLISELASASSIQHLYLLAG